MFGNIIHFFIFILMLQVIKLIVQTNYKWCGQPYLKNFHLHGFSSIERVSRL